MVLWTTRLRILLSRTHGLDSIALNWNHELSLWERFYPRGSPILDVGADPESVRFFENRGQLVYPIGDSFGSHLGAIKIDIDGAEFGLVIEVHGRHRWKTLYQFPNSQTRILRLERADYWHRKRIGLAHWLRLKIDRIIDILT